GNNSPANDQGGPAERQTVNPASPTLVTTAGATITLSSSTPSHLSDSAVLSAGYHVTGMITFTLNAPDGSLVYTDNITVTNNGTYTTSMGDHPGGYALPTTGGATGTYTWHASYSGDANNNSAADQGGPAEQQTVNPASPTLGTTAGANITLSNTAPAHLR